MLMGPRIVKSAIASAGAIWISELIALPSISAGILAILGVQPTRKKTLKMVSLRFLGCLIGLLTGFFIFSILPFQAWVLGLNILILFPILSRLNMQEGMITSFVVILYLYRVQELSWTVLWHELAIIAIGFGMALIVNLSYMPSLKKEAKKVTENIDQLLSEIFLHFKNHLLDEKYIWNGEELIQLEERLKFGKDLALRTIENNLLRNKDELYRYIRMREKQFAWVQHMMTLIARIDYPVMQSYVLVDLFGRLSKQVKQPYYSGETLQKLDELYEEVHKMDLPQTREEFEIRSALFQLLRELQEYLFIAEKEQVRKVHSTNPNSTKSSK